MNTVKPKRTEPMDLIPAREAVVIARTSADTLRRWADEGRLTAFSRPGFKRSAAFYSRAEVEALAPRAR